MIRILKAKNAPRPPKADARERSLAIVFLQAIRSAAQKTNEAALAAALEEKNTDRAVATVRWDAVQEVLGEALPKRYRLIYEEGLRKSRLEAKRFRKDGAGTGFDYTDPESVAWARDRAGRLIYEFGAMSREALRALIARAFIEGIPPRELARLIRDSGIGLTQRQAEAVVRRRAQLIKDGRKLDQVDRMTDRYAAQLLRQRAEAIARTEIIEAHTAGTQAGWREAIDEGLLPPDFFQIWIAGQTERTCDLCAQLHDTKAKLGESFGDDYDGNPIYGPPAHPQCRCSLGLSE